MIQLPACSCQASKDFNDFNHMIKLMQFLMGLDNVYQPVRTNLLIREPLPTVKEAFSVISREESHRNSSGSSKAQVVGFVAKTNQNFERTNQFSENRRKVNKVSNPNLKCSHCNKIGHTTDRCFEIVGYPTWMKKGSQNAKPGASNNSVINKTDAGSFAAESLFTAEQISKLLNLLNEKSSDGPQSCNVAGTLCDPFGSISVPKRVFCFSSNGVNEKEMGWVVDSGANQHMVKSETSLINIVDVSEFNIKVKHPNGTSAIVTKIGNLKLSNEVALIDVFVVPDYCVNLISVYKLAKDSKMIVSFDEHNCYLQDSLTKKVLATGSQCDGLYICVDASKSVKLSNIENLFL
ncbi:hypothetical protein L1987_83696 [Smallanthus sonchifolius]|uniref:Uncharacterized protein n=1 Tax=Smallanthus sonchifolius TaxID=185202 RepID=A0ACB8YDT6_9ASTR|nr:hypothetical protein L1987_83696 [Smallanthus sonchifolius]